jgi:glycosyltransferase involved in cell wall biosynthesis
MVIASRTVETFSIAALEAMALARPMVMSDIGGAREQVGHGDNGLIFPPGNIAALADQLRRLAEPRLRRRMGERARERVAREFDIGRMVRRYEEALLGLQPGRGPA